MFGKEEGAMAGTAAAVPAFFMPQCALNTRQSVREPLRSAHAATTLMRAVFIQTKYECKIIDLDRTSIAGAIENHGGFLRIYYDNSSVRQLAAGEHARVDAFDR